MKSWDSIRYYLAVARQGTVSGAATELAVTHATVLRRIDQFEQDLGLKLFRRHSLGYDLTDAGKTLFERGLSIEAEMRMLEAEARGNDDSSSGRIRVTNNLAMESKA